MKEATNAKGNLQPMARSIEHRSTSEWPAETVYSALIDVEQLKARLAEFGGESAKLVEHHRTPDGDVRFRVSHPVPAESLPAAARSFVGTDLTISRSECWREAKTGYYTGEVAAEIPGVPGSITGSMWLRDLTSSEPHALARSAYAIEASVRVSVPFVGSKIEEMVAEQVHKLLTAEERFANDWIAQHASR